MNKLIKITLVLTILLTLCTFLLACSCSDDNGTHTHPSTNTSVPESSNSSTNNDSTDNDNDNGNSHVHYWYDVEINKETESTSSLILNGKCYTCGDFLSKEVITTVTYEEWKSALSADSFKSFTHNQGNVYTDYDEKGSMSWKITDNIYTDEYFFNSETKNSSVYSDNFTGYSLMYNSFKYNQQTKTYVYNINENVSIELGFADGKLFYHSTNDSQNNEAHRSLYLNHNTVSVEAPSYIYGYYNEIISVESLCKATSNQSLAVNINEFLSTIKLEGKWELSHLENGISSIYIYFDETKTDPLFNGEYNTVSIVAQDGVIFVLTVGDNTYDFSK